MGSPKNEGAIQAFYEGQWLYLNADSWNASKGNLTCKALGYSFATNISVMHSSMSSSVVQWLSHEYEYIHHATERLSDFLFSSSQSRTKAAVKCISKGNNIVTYSEQIIYYKYTSDISLSYSMFSLPCKVSME